MSNSDNTLQRGRTRRLVEMAMLAAISIVLVMLIRTVLNRIWYSVSYDEGAVWTQAKPTLIPSSNAPSVPMRLLDFFLPAPAAVEYCAADPEWVEASRELFCDSAWVEGI